MKITPSDKSTAPIIATHGIQAGDRGSISELISPTPKPIATRTKMNRRATRGTLDIDSPEVWECELAARGPPTGKLTNDLS